MLFVAVGNSALSSQWSYRLSMTAEPINFVLTVPKWTVTLDAPSDPAVVGFKVSWRPMMIRDKSTGLSKNAVGVMCVIYGEQGWSGSKGCFFLFLGKASMGLDGGLPHLPRACASRAVRVPRVEILTPPTRPPPLPFPRPVPSPSLPPTHTLCAATPCTWL